MGVTLFETSYQYYGVRRHRNKCCPVFISELVHHSHHIVSNVRRLTLTVPHCGHGVANGTTAFIGPNLRIACDLASLPI